MSGQEKRCGYVDWDDPGTTQSSAEPDPVRRAIAGFELVADAA